MSRYDALIAKWATLTPGTTDQKLTQVNGLTVNGTATPMIVPTYRIYNIIDPTEFSALTAANQQLVRDILGMGTVDGSPGTSVRSRMLAIFTVGSSPITHAALVALAAAYDTPPMPWWQGAVAQGGGGLTSPVNGADLVAAGGLT